MQASTLMQMHTESSATDSPLLNIDPTSAFQEPFEGLDLSASRSESSFLTDNNGEEGSYEMQEALQDFHQAAWELQAASIGCQPVSTSTATSASKSTSQMDTADTAPPHSSIPPQVVLATSRQHLIPFLRAQVQSLAA